MTQRKLNIKLGQKKFKPEKKNHNIYVYGMQADVQTLHSSWKTVCWIILLLFKPAAMSSKSIADLDKPKIKNP